MMKNKHVHLFISGAALICALLVMKQSKAQSYPVPADLTKSVEVVAAVTPPDPDPSGIAVSKTGRVFLGFPRHADNHKDFALAELVHDKLIPFPDKEYVYPSGKPLSEWLVSPHGMYMDANDILWIIDDGKRAGINGIPEGAAKIVAIDINKKKVVHSIVMKEPVFEADMHLNDLRFDPTHGKEGTVYIVNSGFGQHYSIVVVDVATGRAREVLRNHYATSPDPGFIGFLENVPHVFDAKNPSFPIGGADGIALSPDNKKLYWAAISGRSLYSMNTDTLSDFSLPESAIEKAVHFEGQQPTCDGMASDEKGNLYFGAFNEMSIVQRYPDGQFTVLAHDEKNFGWLDGLAYHDGYLYVTMGQWNRMASFNKGKELRQPPFLVIRVKTK